MPADHGVEAPAMGFRVYLPRALEAPLCKEPAAQAAPLLKVEAGRLEKLLSRGPGFLTKPLSHAGAQRVATVLESAGVHVELVPASALAQPEPGPERQPAGSTYLGNAAEPEQEAAAPAQVAGDAGSTNGGPAASRWPAWLWLAAVAASAAAALGTGAPWGVWVLAGLAVLMLVQASRLYQDSALSGLYAATALLPLAFLFPILVGTLQPWSGLDPLLRAVVASLLVALAALLAARALGYGRRELKLGLGYVPAGARKRRHVLLFVVIALALLVGRLLLQGAIAVAGLGLGALQQEISGPVALPALAGQVPMAWQAALVLLLAAFVEELMCRGLLQNAAVRAFGAPLGILYASVGFGLLYIGALSSWQLGLMVLTGLVFGFLVHRTGSLYGVALAHGLANLVLFGLLPGPAACSQAGVAAGLDCWLGQLLTAIPRLLGG